MQSLFGGTEQALSKISLGNTAEKTYVEKLTAKEEISEIKTLMTKEVLNEADWGKLGNLIGGVEQKLLNYGDTTRYYSGKYITWIQDAITITITHLKNMKITKKTEQTKVTLEAQQQVAQILDQEVKKMINIFLFFNRSSLSLGAMAFDALTKQRLEQEYLAKGFPGTEKEKSKFNFRGGQS